MKKLILNQAVISLIFFLVASFPAFAQDLMTEEVPVESLTLKKGNIPPDVLKTAEEIFKDDKQVEWGAFPYELKNYGWVVDQDYNQPIDHYEIHMKTKDGTDVFAVFESTGQLIRYRTENKNAAIPVNILDAIAKTEYKDWKIDPAVVIITNNQKKVVEHYKIKVQKGNQKKELYYTIKGERLINK